VKRSTSWIAVLPSLVIPACIGLMMYLGMLTLIEQEVIANETVLRYLTGHPVSKITLAMFFIGLASLGMIGANVFEQFSAEQKIRLNDGPVEYEPDYGEQAEHALAEQTEAEESSQRTSATVSPVAKSNNNQAAVQTAIQQGQHLLALPKWMHEHYLWQRMVNALHSVYRSGSARGVDDELKYLADLDLDRQSQRYSLVRILIWATPMLGFLGTVLGISQALGGISVGPENDFQQMMNGLRGSLYVAFDTTALALTLSMVLMFGQFLVDRFESQLLQLVDQRARSEVSTVFAGMLDVETGSLKGPESPIQRELLDVMNTAVKSQTEIWKKTILAAEAAWKSSLSEVSGQVEESLAAAIDSSVYDLAHYLGEAIDRADHSMAHRWEQWQVLLSDNARQLEQQQNRLAEQTRLIQSLLDKGADATPFEPAIATNLHAIEETSRLRETLAELSDVVSGLANETESKPAEIESVPAATELSAEESHEVILPFPSKSKPTENNPGGKGAGDLPEVIIPFPKRAA
jgi:biopolymer transport protein ExbB/TolQ